jgi:hypothetical protein
MQRGGGEAATAPLQTTPGAADRLSVDAPGRCPVQRARQDAQRRAACVNAGLHGPGVETRTGAGMLLLHLPARGLGGVSGKPPPITPRSDNTTEELSAVVAQPRPHKAGGVGVACCPRIKRWRGLPHNTTNNHNTRSDLAAKGGGAALHQPRFAAPHRQVMDFDFVAVFTRKGARHNGFLCEPAGRALLPGARALHKTPLC